jgi:hypothetical protein
MEATLDRRSTAYWKINMDKKETEKKK